jgi:hypothetical protein
LIAPPSLFIAEGWLEPHDYAPGVDYVNWPSTTRTRVSMTAS